MRTVNGLEFENLKTLDLWNSNEVVYEFSVPYEPQQNGRIEYLYGSLLLNAWAMLDAHLNKSFLGRWYQHN